MIRVMLAEAELTEEFGESGILIHWHVAFSFHSSQGGAATAGLSPFRQPTYVSIGLLHDAIEKLKLQELGETHYQRGDD